MSFQIEILISREGAPGTSPRITAGFFTAVQTMLAQLTTIDSVPVSSSLTQLDAGGGNPRGLRILLDVNGNPNTAPMLAWIRSFISNHPVVGSLEVRASHTLERWIRVDFTLAEATFHMFPKPILPIKSVEFRSSWV